MTQIGCAEALTVPKTTLPGRFVRAKGGPAGSEHHGTRRSIPPGTGVGRGSHPPGQHAYPRRTEVSGGTVFAGADVTTTCRGLVPSRGTGRGLSPACRVTWHGTGCHHTTRPDRNCTTARTCRAPNTDGHGFNLVKNACGVLSGSSTLAIGHAAGFPGDRIRGCSHASGQCRNSCRLELIKAGSC